MFRQQTKPKSNFSEILLSLASPESILQRSRGEVLQPETLNYRTHKPEMKGLFCERIFGPVKDWECHCGKYKRIRYRGIICDRCGVEVTEKKVRRERMGHIELVVPIVHIWYFRSLPNKIASFLGLSSKDLDRIIYYENYVVIQPGVKAEEGIERMQFLTEDEYLGILDSLPHENQLLDNNNPSKFIAKMGGEALQCLIRQINLAELSGELRRRIVTDTSQQRRSEALKRLKVIESFKDANTRVENNPEWMILKILPVIPAELRPLLPLEGGKFATSDMNDLYRRVIIRNNRLKRLIDIKAPDIILRNEKRMLQEAVDSLFDNSRRVNAVASEGLRPLKSLSDSLKGKQGRFRQNLLGKRVDYSGRSVIVVGPDLKLHECGIPKSMAAELFKPFIIRRLLERGVVKTVKSAKRLVEQKDPMVWDILENILKGHPVLLNRAPTLHRLGIQAFQPKMIEGKALQLHPLVCTAFNADFDGDQMAVHVPLSQEAVAEASLLMLSSHNILNPSNGSPIAVPSKDMVLGLYYLTKGLRGTPEKPVPGEGKAFYGVDEVRLAIDTGKISLHTYIKLYVKIKNSSDEFIGGRIETTAGRVIFNQYVPFEVGYINEIITNKKLQSITANVHRCVGTVRTAKFLDDMKSLGFDIAYSAGMTVSLGDIKIPQNKEEIIIKAKDEVRESWDNYFIGLITDRERYNQVIDIWTRANTKITHLLMNYLENDKDGFNSLYMMMHSGARGSREQVRQLGGIRGLMAKPQKTMQGSVGETIENPILSNFKEGLDTIEYFISTHGARKGLADTALKTADAGYLTRRLVDVAQDVMITSVDCGTLRGMKIEKLKGSDELLDPMRDRMLGRVVLHDVTHPDTGDIIVAAGEEISEVSAYAIESADVKAIDIRSVLTCALRKGVCSRCYGRNMATNNMVQEGEAVGVIAAQSIGEPGTQLTLSTFHVGGASSTTAVESSIQAKQECIVEFEDLSTVYTVNNLGKRVYVVMSRSCEMKLLDLDSREELSTHLIPYGAYLNVRKGAIVKEGKELCSWDPYNAVILSAVNGIVKFESIEEGVTYKSEYDEQTGIHQKVIIDSRDKTKNPTLLIQGKSKRPVAASLPSKARLVVGEGDQVYAGQVLVKIPRLMSTSRDITGGLPRVTELFEARNPSNAAVVSEINGVVSYGVVKRGNREIYVENKVGRKMKYMIPLTKYILVQDNDYVKAGNSLSDGVIAPASILSILGIERVQDYLVHELQAVYRLQGVRINNKHVELIVRQMLNKVEIIDPGDTMFMPGQLVNKFQFSESNDQILDKKIVLEDTENLKNGDVVSLRTLREENTLRLQEGKDNVQVRDAVPAISRQRLLGITQAALGTDSFISAASFQETIKVLSEASISGKRDPLHGLKENVIVGHSIPCGTGLSKYKKMDVTSYKDIVL